MYSNSLDNSLNSILNTLPRHKKQLEGLEKNFFKMFFKKIKICQMTKV